MSRELMTVRSLALSLYFATMYDMGKKIDRKQLLVALIISLPLLILLAAWRPDIPAEKLEKEYAPSPPSRFLEIEGVRIHYRDQGRRGSSGGNRTIVLVHGTFASLHTWEGWVEELKDEYRIITLDLPGFGLTGPDPSGDYSIERTITILYRFLDTIGVLETGKIHLGGNSLGGRIAWNFALDYPKLCASLILIDAAGYESQSPQPAIFRLAATPGVGTLLSRLTPKFLFRANLKEVYGDPSRFTKDVLNRYYLLTRREGNRQALLQRIGGGGSARNRIDSITELDIPTLIIWGEKDRWIPVENAYRFYEDLPDSQLAILPEAGHVPMEELPEKSVAVLEEFLLVHNWGMQ